MLGITKLFHDIEKKEIKKADEQLLLLKIVNEYQNDKELLYNLLTSESRNDNFEIGVEVQPLTHRKNEGNTNLDLALGSIKTRENTISGIELNKDKINQDFVFCEAKWKSDLSYGVTYCSIRNQLQRIIENALLFADKNFKGKIFVILITPKSYKDFFEMGINTRLYCYKYQEYKNNIKNTFLKELDLIEKLEKILFFNKESKEIIKENLDKLFLNWVTFEELIEAIPNIKNKTKIKKQYLEIDHQTNN
jgi:hypothetical protein